MLAEEIVQTIRCLENHKTKYCWHEHETDKQHDNESHIHVVPAITARICAMISEYIRYKCNPDALENRKGL